MRPTSYLWEEQIYIHLLRINVTHLCSPWFSTDNRPATAWGTQGLRDPFSYLSVGGLVEIEGRVFRFYFVYWGGQSIACYDGEGHNKLYLSQKLRPTMLHCPTYLIYVTLQKWWNLDRKTQRLTLSFFIFSRGHQDWGPAARHWTSP